MLQILNYYLQINLFQYVNVSVISCTMIFFLVPEKTRYGSGRWRDHKPDERYYSRDSQESPWEDEYSNEPAEKPHFVSSSSKRNWKQRPSSASEMDRKTGEIKSRHHPVTGIY